MPSIAQAFCLRSKRHAFAIQCSSTIHCRTGLARISRSQESSLALRALWFFCSNDLPWKYLYSLMFTSISQLFIHSFFGIENGSDVEWLLLVLLENIGSFRSGLPLRGRRYCFQRKQSTRPSLPYTYPPRSMTRSLGTFSPQPP